mmetsp:Transcript_118942/g.167144  ORF Transcript_118942/g.167144 Transcript_118942/m.167144 type:complete len:236 (+) Transcript_118942:36-743(+)
MKYMTPAVLAFANAPSLIDAWSLGPSFYSTPMLLRETRTPGEIMRSQRSLANRMLEQTERMIEEMDRMFEPTRQLAESTEGGALSLQNPWQLSRASPRYELVDNQDTFKLSIDVPGVPMENMEVVVEREGYLTVRGHREVTSPDGNSKYESKFSQSFSLDPSVDVDHLAANLDNGVLTVTAPKDPAKHEEKVHRVQIMGPETKEEVAKLENAKEEEAVIDLDKTPQGEHKEGFTA